MHPCTVQSHSNMDSSVNPSTYAVTISSTHWRATIRSFYPNIDHTPFISRMPSGQCISVQLRLHQCLWLQSQNGYFMKRQRWKQQSWRRTGPAQRTRTLFLDVGDSGRTKPPCGFFFFLVTGATKHCFVTPTNTRTNSTLCGPHTQTREMMALNRTKRAWSEWSGGSTHQLYKYRGELDMIHRPRLWTQSLARHK